MVDHLSVHLAGLALFLIGLGFFGTGLAARRRAIVARRVTPAGHAGDGEPATSLAIFGGIMRPVIIGALICLAAKAAFFYWALGGSRLIPLADFAAFLFLLAGYGTWIVVITKCRAPHHRPELPVRQVPPSSMPIRPTSSVATARTPELVE